MAIPNKPQIQENSSSTSSKPTRKYSSIIITLDNVLIPEEKLSVTPSMEDGLDKDIETNIRIIGCELIQSAGILLKLPQVAMATAQVLFQRFFYEKSFIRHSMEIVAMACLVLASKVEESPRRNRDIINVFHHMKQARNKKVRCSRWCRGSAHTGSYLYPLRHTKLVGRLG